MADRVGLPPLGVKLLWLLEWFHGLRAPRARSAHGTGGALQASPEWLARKLGCSERWIQKLAARLDPFGAWRREKSRVALLNRRRERRGQRLLPAPPMPEGGATFIRRTTQLKEYRRLTADLPPADRLPAWLDRRGQVHEWVDLTGIWFPTAMGVRLLRRRAERSRRPRPGHTPRLRRSAFQVSLYRLLSPVYRQLRARLAPAPQREFTPRSDQPSYMDSVGGSEPVNRAAVVNTGPPAATSPPRSAGHPPPDGGGREIGQAVPSSAPPPPSSRAVPVGLNGQGNPPTPSATSEGPGPVAPGAVPRTRAEASAAWGELLDRAAARRGWPGGGPHGRGRRGGGR
jgi:hypothetical protein